MFVGLAGEKDCFAKETPDKHNQAAQADVCSPAAFAPRPGVVVDAALAKTRCEGVPLPSLSRPCSRGSVDSSPLPAKPPTFRTCSSPADGSIGSFTGLLFFVGVVVVVVAATSNKFERSLQWRGERARRRGGTKRNPQGGETAGTSVALFRCRQKEPFL